MLVKFQNVQDIQELFPRTHLKLSETDPGYLRLLEDVQDISGNLTYELTSQNRPTKHTHKISCDFCQFLESNTCQKIKVARTESKHPTLSFRTDPGHFRPTYSVYFTTSKTHLGLTFHDTFSTIRFTQDIQNQSCVIWNSCREMTSWYFQDVQDLLPKTDSRHLAIIFQDSSSESDISFLRFV